MHTESLVVHEWFYDGGPSTFEYLLPVRDLRSEHNPHLNRWIRRFADTEPSNAIDAFRNHLAEITVPELGPLLDVLSRLAPHSIVIHEKRVWLLCKLPDSFSEMSAHHNMILVSPPSDNVNWRPELSSDSFGPLRHLLGHFAGTKIDIPPTSGFLWLDQLQPAVEDHETGAWKNIRSWQNSLPIYLPGNGDAVLVDGDGRFGRWDHEMTDQEFVDTMAREHGMTPPDDGAVFLIGDFTQFVNFLVMETGIAK